MTKHQQDQTNHMIQNGFVIVISAADSSPPGKLSPTARNAPVTDTPCNAATSAQFRRQTKRPRLPSSANRHAGKTTRNPC